MQENSKNEVAAQNVAPLTEQTVVVAENVTSEVADSTNKYDLTDEKLKEYVEAYQEATQKEKPFNLVIFGPPGAGKGTQSAKITKKYGLAHKSTGDMFRSDEFKALEIPKELFSAEDLADIDFTGANPTVAETLAAGKFVPDPFTLDVLFQNIEEQSGFNFDGFPRTVPQAEVLDKFLTEKGQEVNLVIQLDVSEEEIKRRIAERKVIESRTDDDEEKLLKRLEEYFTKTIHVLPYYQAQGKVVKVNGIGEEDNIFEKISQVIENAKTGMYEPVEVVDTTDANENASNTKEIANTIPTVNDAAPVVETVNDEVKPVTVNDVVTQPVVSKTEPTEEQKLEDELWEEWQAMNAFQKLMYSNNWYNFLHKHKNASSKTSTEEQKERQSIGSVMSKFFVSLSGEDYKTLSSFGKNSVKRYETVGLSTLMDPLLSWFLFAMATSLSNPNILSCIAIGGFAMVVVFLIELVVVRTTPIGQIYNMFTGKIKGSAITFVLFAIILRGGIAYQLGAINGPRATVVMYKEGIIAFDKQQIAEKRETEIKEMRTRRDERNNQAREAEQKLTDSEQAWKKEMTEGGNTRPKGRGKVSDGIEDVKKSQEQRWQATEEARKKTDAKEDAEFAELKKLQNTSVSYDYISMSKILDKMSEKYPEISRDRATIHWLCVLIGMLAFIIKGMIKPGAYERWKELSEEEKIAEQEAKNVASVEKLSEAKEREVVARKKLAISEQELLLAEVSKSDITEQRDKKKREDEIAYVEKNVDRANKLINQIKGTVIKNEAQQKLDRQLANTAFDLLQYKKSSINIPNISMPKIGKEVEK